MSAVTVAILLAACQDLPTSGRAPTAPGSAVRGLHTGQIAVPCTASSLGSASGEWQVTRTTIFFPRSEAAADGSTRSYRYTLYGELGRRVGMVDCEIPATEAALRRMDQRLGVRRDETVVQPMKVALDPIVVQACQNGNPWPDCSTDNTAPPPPPPPGECSVLTCVDGGGNGGDSGGDGGPEASDIIEDDAIPDCTQPQTENALRAYCESKPVQGEALAKVNDVLTRLTSCGGECANIASFGYQLVARGALRTYPYRPEYGNIGGWGSPQIGALIDEVWFRDFASGDPNLVAKVMHEIEHAMGRLDHVVVNGTNMSRNEATCAYFY